MSAAAPEQVPRTIVLFMVDQLAAKWLEVAADRVVELPNFAALRESGVTFENAFSTNPVCSPSRASIATGLSSSAHGVTETGYDLDPEIPTFMRGLQAGGWRTGAFGKLHFITQVETLHPNYHQYGFDVVYNTEDSRAGEWLDWVKVTHPEHYQAAQSTVWMTMVPELLNYGENNTDLRAEILEARRKYPDSTKEAYELPFPAEVSQTAWITDRACDFLQSERGDVFAQISYVQPHNPFAPPAEYVERVNIDRIPDPTRAAWMDNPIPYYRQDRYRTASYDETDWRRQRQLYFADLAHLDHELGRIREALTVAGRIDDTLLIFTSDHGEMLHDQGLLGKWERHYDPCIRVPLIISTPQSPSAVRSELVEHTDIAATIYAWAGVSPPTLPTFVRYEDDGESRMLHGRSLLPLVSSMDPSSWRRHVLIQSNNNHFEAAPRSWARTIRTSRYRYTRHLDSGGEQLFDLIDDPDEQRNLAYDLAFSGVRDELLALIADASVTDAFPTTPRQLFKIGAW